MSCELVENNFENKNDLSHNLKVNVRKIRYKEKCDREDVKDYSQSTENIKIERLNTALLKMARKNIKKSNSSSSTDDRHHSSDHCLSKQCSHSNDSINEQYTNCHYHQHHIHSNENRQSSKQQIANYSSRFQKENTDCLNHQHHLSQNTNHKHHLVTANHHCHDEDEQSSEQLDEEESQDLQEDDDEEYDESDDGIEEIEEEDDGSYTDHDSTTTSTSTLHNLHNMRNDDDKSEKGNCCNCCYCEVFGHGLPTKAPTSRNYDEIRDRLRIRLENKKQCRSVENDDLLSEHHLHKKNSQQIVNQAIRSNDLNKDERDLDELLRFINNDGESTKCEKKSKKKREKKKKKSKVNEDDQLVHVNNHQEIVNKSSTIKHQVNCDNKLRNTTDQLTIDQHTNDKRKLNGKANDHHTKSIISNDETNIDKKTNSKRNQSNKKTTKQDKRQPHAAKQQTNCNGQRYTSSIDKNSSNCKKSNIHKDSLLDDVFLPKDIDYEDGTVVDEFEKELEEFKRFCFNSKPLPNKEKLNLDLKNIVIKKKSSNSANFSSSRRNQAV